jgi:hypothetical protein
VCVCARAHAAAAPTDFIHFTVKYTPLHSTRYKNWSWRFEQGSVQFYGQRLVDMLLLKIYDAHSFHTFIRRRSKSVIATEAQAGVSAWIIDILSTWTVLQHLIHLCAVASLFWSS